MFFIFTVNVTLNDENKVGEKSRFINLNMLTLLGKIIESFIKTCSVFISEKIKSKVKLIYL